MTQNHEKEGMICFNTQQYGGFSKTMLNNMLAVNEGMRYESRVTMSKDIEHLLVIKEFRAQTVSGRVDREGDHHRLTEKI